MRGVFQRVLFLVIGLSVLLVYVAGAFVVFQFVELWLGRIDLGTLVLGLAIATLVIGYGNYRVGIAGVLSNLQATPLPRDRAPELHRRLDRLIDAMDVERPDLRVASLGEPNALSIGSARSGVILLDGELIRLLSLDELEGILAHELAHLESYDGLVRTMAVATAQTLVSLLLLLLLPIVLLVTGVSRAVAWATGRPSRFGAGQDGRLRSWITVAVSGLLFVITLALRSYSRRREFAADDRATEVLSDPLSLARAFERIQRASTTSRGFLSPILIQGEEKESEGLGRLLSTHPSMEERIERIRSRTSDPQRRGSGTETDGWIRIPVE
ncbi:MAG: M48 family metallopeptidase [Halodesulfurarchaeum sp.]